MEEYFLTATDPRGRLVHCSEERFAYLLSKHEESMDLITKEYVKLTIEKPAHGLIYASTGRPERHIYYKRVKGFLAELKVVVEFLSDDDIGKIITVYLCSNRPSGEEIIWPQKSR